MADFVGCAQGPEDVGKREFSGKIRLVQQQAALRPIFATPPSFCLKDGRVDLVGGSYVKSKTVKQTSMTKAPDESTHHNYLPSHTSPACTCTSHIFDDVHNPAVTKLLQASHVPLILVDSSISLTSFPQLSPSPPIYVAISHVRRQGLGNTAASSLPSCQLRRLQRLVDVLYPSSQGQTRVPFWIDTGCIPHNNSGKALALDCLDKVYQKADIVLALDTALLDIQVEENMDNVIRLIGDSAWGRRLWTVREGALALRLRFQFRDGGLDLGVLNEQLLGSRLIRPWTDGIQPQQIQEMDKYNDAFVDLCQIFERDMRAAYGKVPAAVVPADAIKMFREAEYKHHLRDVLRQCYLSTTRYRFFATNVKGKKVLHTREIIESVYQGLNHLELVALQHVDLRDTLNRLRAITEAC